MKHLPAKPNAKLSAIPVRLTNKQDAVLRQLAKQTGFPKASFLRAAIGYALPRFLNGEINILECDRK